ncbi:DNA-formamidopyrimidine glycosylase [Ktedonospora formicarum]|uniref:Formamidopyrimidine-DNA glycosylase n=1 Tax=Ktedonospora formicarum TaxID=2778364 RepID=A0A8J3MU62_9CHLR|nr:DNA-formamidopyrimidine glycosylase [Ktedonospora formicarum]GHO45095.1 formamidopyrimidine-DNA glycosylase [Ktedonospora formicarum]
MPELPEVEYTARQLRASIVGATIREAHVFWERIIAHPLPEDFRAQVTGRLIEGVRRRGKYLLIDLNHNGLLIIHRRMTGNFLLMSEGWQLDTSLRERDASAWSTKGPTFSLATAEGVIHDSEMDYCRVSLVLEDGRNLLFTDPRKFGRVSYWERECEEEALAGLGPEPFSEAFSIEGLTESLAHKRSPIKQVLLDQTVIAGVGNIYADEALFYASIHPRRPANSLTSGEIAKLHEGVIAVLTKGIEHGGTSFSSYRDLWGEAGDNYNHVHVYKQTGKPCVRCGTLIERTIVAQRSTHFCPGCQSLTLE